jgi:dCMP deaminase
MGHVEEHYLALAYETAVFSTDPDTKNAAVIVSEKGERIGGWNRIPQGLLCTSDRLQRPEKYDWVLHAEHTAILNAARLGVYTYKAVMYCPWFACDKCALSIVQSGIKRVVGHSYYYAAANPLWDPLIDKGVKILEEGGVAMEWVESPIRGAPKIWVAGKAFDPSKRSSYEQS